MAASGPRTSEVGDDLRLLELTLDHGAKIDAKDSYEGPASSAPPNEAFRASFVGCSTPASTATT
jgi:hypothetical protein